MENLITYLEAIPSGELSDTAELEPLLANCWSEFSGSEDQAMRGSKLRGRMESVFWNPPLLRFIIERHGITVQGSSRADLHKWEVNLLTKKATCVIISHRQIHPMQPRLDVKSIAEEIVKVILNGQEDVRLKWYKDGDVRVHVGKILPDSSAVK